MMKTGINYSTTTRVRSRRASFSIKRLVARSFLCAALVLHFAFVVAAQETKPANETATPATTATPQTPAPAAPSTTDQRDNAPKNESITGRVVTEDGEPLAGASVSILARGGSASYPTTLATDDEGRFRATGLAPGAYRISVHASGYAVAPDPSGRDHIYRVGESATVLMVKGGVITGMVTNALGEPVVAARVRAVRVRNTDGRPLREPFTAWTGREWQTDDRGVYRIFGLPPGSYVVAAGGLGPFNWSITPYDDHAPTYYPSSTRDSAAEVDVRAGQETGGIDIRYKGERGHAVSGTVSDSSDSASGGVSVTLIHVLTGTTEANQFVPGRGTNAAFSFEGVGDGEYELIARRQSPEGNHAASSPRRVFVRGGDVTGVVLTLAPLGSLSGSLTLASSPQIERQPLCAAQAARNSVPQESLILLLRNDKGTEANQPAVRLWSRLETSPDSQGAFTFRGLTAGRHHLRVNPPDERWYVFSITAPATPPTTTTTNRAARATTSTPAARAAFDIKAGEGVAGVAVTLMPGAATLRGRVAATVEGARLPARLRVHLVPVEKERADDALRYVETFTREDGVFTFSNVAPGRYHVVVRPLPADEFVETAGRPVAWEAAGRAELRREAASSSSTVELQPCQRFDDFTARYAAPAAP